MKASCEVFRTVIEHEDVSCQIYSLKWTLYRGYCRGFQSFWGQGHLTGENIFNGLPLQSSRRLKMFPAICTRNCRNYLYFNLSKHFRPVSYEFKHIQFKLF